MSEPRLTFKEMCAKYDVTPRTLRYYEYILRGRRFGFPLEVIRQWLQIYENEGTKAQMEVWVEHADSQLVDLQEQRDQLDETMAELKRLRDLTVKQLA